MRHTAASRTTDTQTHINSRDSVLVVNTSVTFKTQIVILFFFGAIIMILLRALCEGDGTNLCRRVDNCQIVAIEQRAAER